MFKLQLAKILDVRPLALLLLLRRTIAHLIFHRELWISKVTNGPAGHV